MLEVTTTEEAITALGVTEDTLTAAQCEQLDTQGFLILAGVADEHWVDEMRERLETLLEMEGTGAGHEVARQPEANMLSNLLNKGEMFERMLRAPRVLAAVHHVLGDMKVNSLNYRTPLPDDGQQILHSDMSLGYAPDGGYQLCNSMWVVDDFTLDNGPTRVVPGTHLTETLPGDALEDTLATHPDEVLVEASAGSVIVFNGHLWHSGTHNRIGGKRGGMTLSFVRRFRPQQNDQAYYIRKQVYDRLSPAERFLMDV